jgi:membrane-anchored glycerophosphoryl diester phosphodiesterase (GDPDase)
MNEWKAYVLWSGFGALSLAISIINGVDITTEGIASIVINGIFSSVVAIIFSILLFASGIYSTYREIESFLEQDWKIITLGISCFLAMFLIYLGMSFEIDWIQNLGVIPLLIAVGFIFYFIKTE